jgi:hypothetical protein
MTTTNDVILVETNRDGVMTPEKHMWGDLRAENEQNLAIAITTRPVTSSLFTQV